MEALTPAHLLLLLVGFIVLFGYKKLPDASRSVGRSLRIFKTEMHAINGDAPSEPTAGAPVAAPAPVAPMTALEAEAAAAAVHAAELRARADAHARGERTDAAS